MNSQAVREEQKIARFPRRTLMIAGAIGLLHLVVAYLLDAAGLIESLLSPSGPRVLVVLPLALLLYALRLTTYFVIPGVVAGSLLVWIVERKSIRGS